MPFSSGMKQLRRTRISTFWALGSRSWKLAYSTVSSPSCSVYHFQVEASAFHAPGSGSAARHASMELHSYIMASFRKIAPVWRMSGAKYQSPHTRVV